MSEIVLVCTNDTQFTEEELAITRKVLFGKVDGLGPINKKKWRRFFSDMFKMGEGEATRIITHKARSGPFHNFHMLMEQKVFAAPERFDNFDKGFRDWLKVGAGHCDWHPGPKGGVFPVPKSISYADMEEHEMRDFHAAAIEFLRTPYAQKTLWKHLSEAARAEFMETIIERFER